MTELPIDNRLQLVNKCFYTDIDNITYDFIPCIHIL